MTRVPSPALSRLPRGHLSPQTHFKHGISREKQQLASASFSVVQRADPGPQSSRWIELLSTYNRWQGLPPVTSSHHRWLTNTEFWGSAVCPNGFFCKGTCDISGLGLWQPIIADVTQMEMISLNLLQNGSWEEPREGFWAWRSHEEN